MHVKKTARSKKKKGFDLNKREFIKTGILAGAAGISLATLSKIPFAKAGVVSNAELKNYSESVNVIGNAVATQDIDLSLGNVVTATIITGTTFTFSNLPASGRA